MSARPPGGPTMAGMPGTSSAALKIGWVLGWAVPEVWFGPLARTAFPMATHTFVPAAPDALARLEAAGPFDWVAGYSLGSLLLLVDSARAERLGRVVLLAPIFAFLREHDRGGRMARAQVRLLARWLRRDPMAALADFYGRAGLVVPSSEAPDEKVEDLNWGLERLENAVAPPALPAGWCAWCGADDPLIDVARLRALAPEISIVPGATHHPAALLRAFAGMIPTTNLR